MNKCAACELPIKPDDQQPGCKEGVFYHRICYDIGVANTAAQLEAFARNNVEWMKSEGMTLKKTSPEEVLQKLTDAIKGWRVAFNNELQLQDAVERLIFRNHLNYVREYRANATDRPDFIVEEHTALEIKTKTYGFTEIMRQMERYSKIPEVLQLIVMCPKPYEFPKTIGGKPLHCIAIWTAMI